MKLVVATPLYPPETGGPATYAKLLAEKLPPKGMDVETVKFGEVRHMPKIVRHIAYFFRARHALKNADAVLALDPVSVGFPSYLGARVLRKPFFVKVVGDYAWEQGVQRFGITESLDDFVRNTQVPFIVWVLRKVQTLVARSARAVIVPSEYLKKIIIAWGVPAENIHVIYNSVQQENTGVVPEVVSVLPRPLIVTAGRLVPWKNMDGVIDATRALRARGIKASLVVVGDGALHASLASRAKETLGDACIFTGALSHADTLATVQSADVFVLNSSYEGLSHLLIEAQTLGVPTIATSVGGNPEVITNEKDGVLVPVGDTEALEKALARILSDVELQKHLREEALKSANRFSTDAMLSATYEIFQKNI